MGRLSGVSALLAAAACCAALAPRPGVARLRGITPRGRTVRGGGSQPPAAGQRVSIGQRAIATGLAAVAAKAFVGGAVGWFAGIAVGIATWVGLGRLEPAAAVRRRHAVAAAVPLAAELLAAAVAAGTPPDRAAEAVGEAIGGPLGEALIAGASATRVGADPPSAWAAVLADPAARSLGRAMLRSITNGSSPVGALERAARDARDTARWAAEAKARSIGARAAAPLGLCFLPAFILVAIVPLVATLGMPLLP